GYFVMAILAGILFSHLYGNSLSRRIFTISIFALVLIFPYHLAYRQETGRVEGFINQNFVTEALEVKKNHDEEMLIQRIAYTEGNLALAQAIKESSEENDIIFNISDMFNVTQYPYFRLYV